MIDFDVPLNPGWGERFREKHGDVEDDVQVVSPAFRRAIQKAQLRVQLLKAAVETPDELITSDASSEGTVVDRELIVV